MKRIYYKYFSIADETYGIENIKKSQLWATQINILNDLFECDPQIDKKRIIEKLRLGSKESKPYIRELRKQLDILLNIGLGYSSPNLGIRSDLLCTSLTLDPLNIMMWSHYGDKNRGVCVGYEIDDKKIKKLLGPYASIDKVTYSNNRVNWPCEMLINYRKNINAIMKLLKTTMCHKAKIWQYEKEYRITFQKTKEKLEEKYELFKVKIKEIYLGNQISIDKREEILKICRGKKFSSIKIFEVKKDTKKYRLYPVQL